MATRDLTHDIEDAFERLSDEYEAFEDLVTKASGDVRTRLEPSQRRLSEARERAAASYRRFIDEEGSHVEASLDALDDALFELRRALADARRDLSAETAKQVEPYRQAFRDQSASWKGKLESLALQADLARMDIRDEIAELHDNYIGARRTVHDEFRQIESEGSNAWESVRDRARVEFEAIGTDYDRLIAKLRAS